MDEMEIDEITLTRMVNAVSYDDSRARRATTEHELRRLILANPSGFEEVRVLLDGNEEWEADEMFCTSVESARSLLERTGCTGKIQRRRTARVYTDWEDV